MRFEARVSSANLYKTIILSKLTLIALSSAFCVGTAWKDNEWDATGFCASFVPEDQMLPTKKIQT